MSQDSTVSIVPSSFVSSVENEACLENDFGKDDHDAISMSSDGRVAINNFSDRVYFHNVHHHEHHNHREIRTVKRARVHFHVHHHHHYHVGESDQQEQERAAEATAEDQTTNAKVLRESPPEMIAGHGEVRS